MGGLYIVILMIGMLISYFSDILRGRKPDRKEADAVLSLFVLFLSPIASLATLALILGAPPWDLNSLVVMIMISCGWWLYARLSFYVAEKFQK